MKIIGPLALSCALCALAAPQPARAADDEPVPSFKKEKDRETKDFASQVGTAIVRAARTKAQKVELEKYEYTKPKAGRSELKLKMIYYGLVTKKKYNSDISVSLDTADAAKWEVLNIDYKDTNTGAIPVNVKNVQALIPKLNR